MDDIAIYLNQAAIVDVTSLRTRSNVEATLWIVHTQTPPFPVVVVFQACVRMCARLLLTVRIAISSTLDSRRPPSARCSKNRNDNSRFPPRKKFFFFTDSSSSSRWCERRDGWMKEKRSRPRSNRTWSPWRWDIPSLHGTIYASSRFIRTTCWWKNCLIHGFSFFYTKIQLMRKVIPAVALDIFYGKKKAIRERRFIILLNFT